MAATEEAMRDDESPPGVADDVSEFIVSASESAGSESESPSSEEEESSSDSEEEGKDAWSRAVGYLLSRESRGAKLDVHIAKLNAFFVCELCDGYFREPSTITRCGHTFCRSCLFKFFAHGNTRCPTCSCALGVNPEKLTLTDPIKDSLVRKLMPHLDKEDAEAEEKMLEDERRRQGLTPRSDTPRASSGKRKGHLKMRRELARDLQYVCLQLEPAEEKGPFAGDLRFTTLPRLDRPYLCTLGTLKVAHLARYIGQKLDVPESSIALLCQESLLMGSDHTMEFIRKTKWQDRHRDMVIQYIRLLP